MLSALCHGRDVLAWDVTKEDAPFSCPMCNAGVVVKKGRMKIHHFAHIPPSDCAYGTSESESHRKAKVDIYDTLRQNPLITKLQLERHLGEVRPDISFRVGNTFVAVEMQISTLSVDTIEKRTKAYTQKGIHLLWISPYNMALDEERYSPRVWEKYIHTLYFGNVYYCLSGETLLPVHFDDYQLYVEESSWWEGEGQDASERSEGGYYRYSKRYRTPRHGKTVKITELSPITRKPWSSKGMSLPAARLWCLGK